MAKVKIPPEVAHQTKSELALNLVDQVITWGVPSRPVVADSFYGNEFHFREQLRRRGLQYAVQVESTTVAWDTDPHIPLPAPKRTGRPRKHPPLESRPQARALLDLAKSLPADAWHRVEWR